MDWRLDQTWWLSSKMTQWYLSWNWHWLLLLLHLLALLASLGIFCLGPLGLMTSQSWGLGVNRGRCVSVNPWMHSLRVYKLDVRDRWMDWWMNNGWSDGLINEWVNRWIVRSIDRGRCVCVCFFGCISCVFTRWKWMADDWPD